MSDIIQLLPDSVANQIAAGEVIQRPASVIKELVENAVDAGAKNINILVVDAGRTSIQVVDDGKGMSETDARLAFERHATSKITKADDLFSLHTMGFRGEALASVAAVAQVELRTRVREEEVGTMLSVAASKVTGQEPVSCPVGSNFIVQNLFYNVPARRKFLKSNTTELNNILAAFERIALVYPDVHFTVSSNGSELFNLRACGLRQRIVDIFGKRLNQDILPIKVDTTVCRISGFIGKPEAARKKTSHQYFFVNGRFMKHPYFHKAVMTAFERLVPVGGQVPYFIYFDVNPHDIDVNIHPTKTEIKFENEQTIWQILAASVKEAVGRFNDIPSIDFDTEGKPDIPVFAPAASAGYEPKVKYNPMYNPFKETAAKPVADNWEMLFQAPEAQPEEQQILFAGPEPGHPESVIEDKAPSHYQYKGRYIMTAVKSGLMVIDQHRAHVRILYDGYMDRYSGQRGNTQKVLFPEIVQFPPSEAVVLSVIVPDMESLGFEMTDMGGGSYAVAGVPAGLDGVNVVSLVNDMVNSAIERKGAGARMADDIKHTLALGLARNAAIPYGQVLSNEEMESVVNELFTCGDVNHSPDGKAILGILRQDELENLLK